MAKHSKNNNSAQSEKARAENARAKNARAENAATRVPRPTRGTPRASSDPATTIAHHEARPIVVVGIGLVAAIILSLVVLITTTPLFGQTVESMDLMPALEHNPWTLAAFLLMLYCLGAGIALIVLILKKIYLRRTIRYIFAAISVAGFIFIAALCFLSIVEVSFYGNYFYGICRAMILIRWPLLLFMGASFGIAMPVGEAPTALEKIRRYPRRLRILISMGVLAWTCLVFLFLEAWTDKLHRLDSIFLLLHRINVFIAEPLLLFLLLGIFVTIVLMYLLPRKPRPEPLVPPRPLVRCLFWIPLFIVGFFCVISAMSLVQTPESYALVRQLFSLTPLTFSVMGVAGISFGVALSQMQS